MAPPPPAGALPTTTVGLKKLETLVLSCTQVTDAGCATLASALDSGALPALKRLTLDGTPASTAAKAAVYEARDTLEPDESDYESEEDEGEEDEEGDEEDEEGEDDGEVN